MTHENHQTIFLRDVERDWNILGAKLIYQKTKTNYFERDWNIFGAKLIYQAASMFGYWQYLFTKNFRKP